MKNSEISIILENYPEFQPYLKRDCLALKNNILLIAEKNKDNIFTSIDGGDKAESQKFVDLAYTINNLLDAIEMQSFKDDHISQSIASKKLINDILPSQMVLSTRDDIETISLEDVKIKSKPLAFSYKGKMVSVKSWRHLTKKLLTFLFEENPEIFVQFIYNPTLNGAKSEYFSYKAEGMIVPLKLKNKDRTLFVDIDKLLLNNKRILKSVLKAYGYPPNRLEIVIEKKTEEMVS